MVKAEQERVQATKDQDKRIADQLAKIKKIYMVMKRKPYVLQQQQKNEGFHTIIDKIIEGEKS